MPILYDAGTLNITTSISGGSFSHVGTDGPGRMAVFVLGRSAGSGGNPPAPSTLTYDGVTMLPLVANAYIQATSFRRLCVAVLPNYNPGTKNIVWTTTYANWAQFGFIMTFTNVLGYRDVVAESTGNGVTSRSQSASLAIKEWIVGGVVCSTDWVDSGGQINRANGWEGDFLASTEEAFSAGTKTLTWSGSSSLVSAGGVVLTAIPDAPHQAIWCM